MVATIPGPGVHLITLFNRTPLQASMVFNGPLRVNEACADTGRELPSRDGHAAKSNCRDWTELPPLTGRSKLGPPLSALRNGLGSKRDGPRRHVLFVFDADRRV